MPGPRGFLTDQEKENLPKVSWDLIKRILGYLTPCWVKFLMVFATILLSSVLGLLPSIITGRIVDEALVGGYGVADQIAACRPGYADGIAIGDGCNQLSKCPDQPAYHF